MGAGELKILIWLGGIIFALINVWGLFLIKGIKQDHKDVVNTVNRNERAHVDKHAHLHEKINTLSSRMDREFVHKSDFGELKEDMKKSFNEVKQLIRDINND